MHRVDYCHLNGVEVRKPGKLKVARGVFCKERVTLLFCIKLGVFLSFARVLLTIPRRER